MDLSKEADAKWYQLFYDLYRFCHSFSEIFLDYVHNSSTDFNKCLYSNGISGKSIKVFLPMSLIMSMGLTIQRHPYKVQRQFTIQHILLGEEMTKSKKLSTLLAEKNNVLLEQALRDALTNHSFLIIN